MNWVRYQRVHDSNATRAEQRAGVDNGPRARPRDTSEPREETPEERLHLARRMLAGLENSSGAAPSQIQYWQDEIARLERHTQPRRDLVRTTVA
ncbi:MAG: hypothetical protein U5O39_03425 [Gammaproteobacteria bacterium]|nr:hypothetical protein [Gammaproteobacteria bacterium]